MAALKMGRNLMRYIKLYVKSSCFTKIINLKSKFVSLTELISRTTYLLVEIKHGLSVGLTYHLSRNSHFISCKVKQQDNNTF